MEVPRGARRSGAVRRFSSLLSDDIIREAESPHPLPPPREPIRVLGGGWII
ncbi:hypothetical protein NQZ68_025410 [Dissostichus eleginoides]|nr:hypothetical protein NQZ68_025410 [Dissostichus eleginoides]